MEYCLVLSARRYDFKDDAGKQVAGVTVTYLTGEGTTEGDTLGMPPMNISAASEVWPGLATLPGWYEMDFKQRPGKGGKPALQLVKVKLVEPLELAPHALSQS